MGPRVDHFVYTIQSSFCTGGHFYSMRHICQTLIARQDDYRAPGDVGTNQSIAISYAYMVWYGLELLRPQAELFTLYGLSRNLSPLALRLLILSFASRRNLGGDRDSPGDPTVFVNGCAPGYGPAARRSGERGIERGAGPHGRQGGLSA
jgi:hypothetical protein